MFLYWQMTYFQHYQFELLQSDKDRRISVKIKVNVCVWLKLTFSDVHRFLFSAISSSSIMNCDHLTKMGASVWALKWIYVRYDWRWSLDRGNCADFICISVMHLNEFLNYIDEFGIVKDSVVSFNLSLLIIVYFCVFNCVRFVKYDESV